MHSLLLCRLVGRWYPLRIAQLQFRKRVQLFRQASRIRRIRVRSAQQIRQSATSKGALKADSELRLDEPKMSPGNFSQPLSALRTRRTQIYRNVLKAGRNCSLFAVSLRSRTVPGEPRERQIEALDCKAVTLFDHNRKPLSRHRCTVEVRSEGVGEDWPVLRAAYNSALDSLAKISVAKNRTKRFPRSPYVTGRTRLLFAVYSLSMDSKYTIN